MGVYDPDGMLWSYWTEHMSEFLNDNRPFPIQQELRSGRWGKKKACSIPWWLAEIAYQHYVKLYGDSQSIERIAQRGGFGRDELILLLEKRDPTRDKLPPLS